MVAVLIASLVAKVGFPLPTSENRIGHIDALRGFIALAVAIHHGYIWLNIVKFNGVWAHPANYIIDQLGVGSVGLFFMATGLVFYPRILRGFRGNNWISIFIGRAFRILPLVAVSFVIITSIISSRTHGSFDSTYFIAAIKWLTAWAEKDILGYTDSARLNAYVFWSLWYEWMFYIFVMPSCALAMQLLHRQNIPSIILPLGLMTIGGIARTLYPSVPGWFGTVWYLPLFASGMLTAELIQFSNVRKILQHRYMSIVGILMLLCAMSLTRSLNAFSISLFSVFFATIAGGNSLFGLLRYRGAQVLGECSFSIYVLHGIILFVIFNDGASAIASMPTWIAASVIVPMIVAIVLITPISYLAIERPAIKIGKRFALVYGGRRSPSFPEERSIAP